MMIPGSKRLVQYFMLLVLGLSWGLQFALVKITASAGYSEVGLLTIALLAMTLVYGVVLMIRGDWFTVRWRHIRFFTIGTAFGYVVPIGVAFYVAPQIPAGVLTLIASMTPVVTMAIVIVIRSEQVSARRIAGVLVGCMAAGLVLAPDVLGVESGNWRWLSIAFVIPLAYGIDNVYIHVAWPRGLGTFQVCAGECLVAALLLLPLYIASGDYIAFTWPLTPELRALLGFVATSVIEVFLYFHIIKKHGALLASFAGFITIFAGLMWGWLIFAEQPDLSIWAAVLVLVLATWLIIERDEENSSGMEMSS